MNLFTHWLLSHDELLDLLHLGDVVLVGFELALADPLVDADQSLSGDVFPVVHTWHTRESRVTSQRTVKVDGFIHSALRQNIRIGTNGEGGSSVTGA